MTREKYLIYTKAIIHGSYLKTKKRFRLLTIFCKAHVQLDKIIFVFSLLTKKIHIC